MPLTTIFGLFGNLFDTVKENESAPKKNQTKNKKTTNKTQNPRTK